MGLFGRKSDLIKLPASYLQACNSNITSSFSPMGWAVTSQFFWMQEQNLFLILFSGRPGRCLLIVDHFLPNFVQSSMIFLSYSSDQSSFLILGSSLFMNLYLICFPVFVPRISESNFQFFPIFFISFLMVSSSSADHIFWWASSLEMRLKRCRHWFSLRSAMSEAMRAHFLGQAAQRLRSCQSSCTFQPLTCLFLKRRLFWRTQMLTWTPSWRCRDITNWPQAFSSI